MDTKKLFEYEVMLESMKPELTEAELISTLKNPDSAKNEIENIASFNITPGEDGLYIKFIDNAGNQKKVMFLNPIVAKSLASDLINSLSAQGYIEDDIIELDEVDAHTLH